MNDHPVGLSDPRIREIQQVFDRAFNANHVYLARELIKAGYRQVPDGRWLFGVLAERDGITRTWTIETSREDAEAALDQVPPEYENPRVMKRWESEWMEVE